MSEKIKVNISISPPLVYLDTCAYDIFFRPEHQDEKARFIKIMNKKRATLMVSWVNVVELGGKLSDSQIEEIYSSFNKIETLPIEVAPNTVIKGEQAVLKAGRTFLARYIPIVCEEIMAWSEDVSNWKECDGVYCYPRIGDFLREYHYTLIKKQEPEKHFDKLYKRLESIHKDKVKIKDIKAAIQKRLKMKKDLKEKNRFTFFTGEVFSLATQLVLRSDIKSFKKDASWFDLWHAIVPISYCNIVILDGRWKHFATQILRKYGLEYPNIAKVFIFNRKEITTMLDELEKSLIIP